MKKIINSIAIIMGLTVFLLPSIASAGISVLEADWTGVTRSAVYENEITAFGNWKAPDEEFTVSWDIERDSTTGLYTYEYTFNKPAEGAAALSHWILEVTDPSLSSDFWLFNVHDITEPTNFTSANGNPSMPDDGMYGIKVDTQGTLFTFVTYKDPVWGDFYAKDGKSDGVDNVAFNASFGSDPIADNSDNFTDFSGWIATPNGGHVIPEPASMLLLGSGLLGFAGLRRKRK
ncbi:MAG: VPLPA-CTERM sorting domain-containing protein [Thermodesulfovibrionia bacterium]|nr:VPLPA-CTERM sorting domain-containing protein [Thermodesulfovibrionia bacterium]